MHEINPAGKPKVAPEKRFAFNKKELENIAPPLKGRAIYSDTDVRELQLRVTTNGHKSFSLYRKVNGRVERYTIGDLSHITVEQARKRARELNAKFDLGENPADKRRTLRAEMTFGAMFQDYLEHYARPHKRTWEQDKATFDRHLVSLAKRKMSEVTKDDLVKLHRRIGKRTPYSANRTLELISAMYNRARNESEWTGENPATGIKAFPEDKRQRFLDAEELPRFFESLAAETNTAIRDLVLTYLLTGARRSNCEAMRWEEIKWSRAVWEVPSSKAKSGKPLDVLLIPAMIRLLERRRLEVDPSCPWVFPSHGATGHLVEPRTAWARILERAKLRDVRMHDLRRTLGSWQAIGGASLPIIGQSLGHTSLQATQVYARLHESAVRTSVERATDRMLESAPQGFLLEATGDRHE
jgi:integrase